jgi:hypothetical protein
LVLQNPIYVRQIPHEHNLQEFSMPSLEVAQALLGFETQKALSLPMAAVIFGAVSQVETVMEIVDRVCDPFIGGAVKTANSTQPGF